jgi:hypothetical protein
MGAALVLRKDGPSQSGVHVDAVMGATRDFKPGPAIKLKKPKKVEDEPLPEDDLSKACAVTFTKGYDDTEARDDHGRWTGGAQGTITSHMDGQDQPGKISAPFTDVTQSAKPVLDATTGKTSVPFWVHPDGRVIGPLAYHGAYGNPPDLMQQGYVRMSINGKAPGKMQAEGQLALQSHKPPTDAQRDAMKAVAHNGKFGATYTSFGKGRDAAEAHAETAQDQCDLIDKMGAGATPDWSSQGSQMYHAEPSPKGDHTTHTVEDAESTKKYGAVKQSEIKRLHAELTSQGVSEDHPIRGVLDEAQGRAYKVATTRSPDGKISGMAAYDDPQTLGYGDKDVVLKELRSMFTGSGAGQTLMQHLASKVPTGGQLKVRGAVGTALPFYMKMGAQFYRDYDNAVDRNMHFTGSGVWSPNDTAALAQGKPNDRSVTLNDPYDQVHIGDNIKDPEPGTPNGGIAPITAAEARGNSRPVTAEEFNTLAQSGRKMLKDITSDKRTPTAFNSMHTWNVVQQAAFNSIQEPWGGQTIDPATGQAVEPDHGYALTIRDAHHSDPISVPIDASQQELSAAMDEAKTRYAGKLQGKSVYLGVFRDDDENRVDIDPVAIVQTPEEVEALGAYCHSIGGAYDFSTGDGYFPPHVADQDQT